MNKFSKGILVLALSLVLGFGVFKAQADEQHEGHSGKMKMSEPSGEVILQGEVLDLYCFMKHPDSGQGPGHAKCAQTCIRKGLPIGFLSDGTVYLIIGKEHENAMDMMVDFAGTQSELTGTIVDHHGVKAIEISSIKEAPAKH